MAAVAALAELALHQPETINLKTPVNYHNKKDEVLTASSFFVFIPNLPLPLLELSFPPLHITVYFSRLCLYKLI
jgi:hypothetical protein